MRFGKSLFMAVAMVLSAAGALSMSAAVAQTTNSQILVLNLAKLRQDAPAWKDMSTKLKTMVDAKTSEFRSQNQAAAQALQTEANALRPLVQGKSEAEINANAALRTRIEAQLRREQDLGQKQQLFQLSVQNTTERAEGQLLELLDPIIGQIMAQRGAVVVLDRSQIAKALPSVDVTQEATTRFNAANPRAPQPVWSPVTISQAPQPPAAAKK